MPFVELNYIAVLVTAAVGMVIGALWYSPLLFANQWMKLVGKTKADLKGAQTGYLVAAVASLIAAYVLAHFVDYAGATTLEEGSLVGFWAWLGFVATTSGVNYIFSGKPRNLYLIENGHHLLTFLVAGAILAVWR